MRKAKRNYVTKHSLNTGKRVCRVKRGKLTTVMVLLVTLALVFTLAGCKTDTPAPGDQGSEGGSDPGTDGGSDKGTPTTPWPAGILASGQFIKYDVKVTVGGTSGTGWVSFTISAGDGQAVKIDYAGKGPGIAGAPVWDGHEFSGTAVATDPTDCIPAILDSLDGGSSPMTKPLLQPWKELFSGQTSWNVGTTWRTAADVEVKLTEAKAYAGIDGVVGQIDARSISFCATPGVGLPLYVKVVDNSVTLEYSAVEATGFEGEE